MPGSLPRRTRSCGSKRTTARDGAKRGLDDHFTDLNVVDENVNEAEEWARIQDLPDLWNQISSNAVADSEA